MNVFFHIPRQMGKTLAIMNIYEEILRRRIFMKHLFRFAAHVSLNKSTHCDLDRELKRHIDLTHKPHRYILRILFITNLITLDEYYRYLKYAVRLDKEFADGKLTIFSSGKSYVVKPFKASNKTVSLIDTVNRSFDLRANKVLHEKHRTSIKSTTSPIREGRNNDRAMRDQC